MNNLRILLVEDETLIADIYERLLGRLVAAFPGSTVTRVETAEDMMDIMRGLAPDVTVLDLTLKDASRETTIMEIRNIAIRSPVVVVTGSSEPSVRRLVMEQGASEFIYKPEIHANPNILERAVIKAIMKFKQARWKGLSEEIEALRKFANEHGPET